MHKKIHKNYGTASQAGPVKTPTFFPGRNLYPCNSGSAQMQRKPKEVTSETAAPETKEKETAKKDPKRGHSFWRDLFTRPFKAIGRLFGSEKYSEQELQDYLNYITQKKVIENRYDSDNKARALVNRTPEFGPYSAQIKILLIREMMKGATLHADEKAIIALLLQSSLEEMANIVHTIGREKLWGEFGGYNRRVIEAITLTEADLTDKATQSRLQGLSKDKLEDYQKNARSPAVAAAISKIIQLKAITTPLDLTADVDKAGKATLQINGFTVHILADKRSGNPGKGAVTKVQVEPGEFGEYTMDGVTKKVKSWDGPTAPKVTIQTIYDDDAQPEGSSGYGRGTTTKDKHAGNTSLKFHEGHHGLDALQYLRENPPPAFAGSVGMSPEDFTEAVESYRKAIADYQTALLLQSINVTDCSGTPISEEQLEKAGAPKNACD